MVLRLRFPGLPVSEDTVQFVRETAMLSWNTAPIFWMFIVASCCGVDDSLFSEGVSSLLNSQELRSGWIIVSSSVFFKRISLVLEIKTSRFMICDGRFSIFSCSITSLSKTGRRLTLSHSNTIAIHHTIEFLFSHSTLMLSMRHGNTRSFVLYETLEVSLRREEIVRILKIKVNSSVLLFKGGHMTKQSRVFH